MKRLIPFSAVCILLLLAMCLSCFALFPPITNEDLILISHDVIHGIVKEVRCDWNEDHSMIYSYVTLEVLEVFKGDPRDEVAIQLVGGTIGDTSITASDEAEIEEGMEVIIHTFLDENGILWIKHGARGLYINNYDGERGLYINNYGFVKRLDTTINQYRSLVDELSKQKEEE